MKNSNKIRRRWRMSAVGTFGVSALALVFLAGATQSVGASASSTVTHGAPAQSCPAPSPGQTKNVCYLTGHNGSAQTKLDLYVPERPVSIPPGAAAPYPPLRGPSPVTLIVHGSGMDKTDPILIDSERPWFNSLNNIYVSVNYRDSKDVSDVAAAIRWVEQNITKYGGNPRHINLIGYQLGAEIVSRLVVTGGPGFGRANIAGVTGVGGVIYPKTVPRRPLPPFLVKWAHRDISSKDASMAFVTRLRAAKGKGFIHAARWWNAATKNQTTVLSDIGKFNDPETQVQLDFIEAQYGTWVWQQDVQFGKPDPDGKVISAEGSNINTTTWHDGKLYAPVGSWNAPPIVWPYKRYGTTTTQKCGTLFNTPGSLNPHARVGTAGWYGGSVIVKDSATSPWKVSVYLGEKTLRVAGMENVVVTTNSKGQKLQKPAQVLMAGATNFDPPVYPIYWWEFNDQTQKWDKFFLTNNSVAKGGTGTGSTEKCSPEARVFISHFNKFTGVDQVFIGTSSGLIFSGAYDSAKHRVVMNPKPEFSSPSGRPLAAINYKGHLYFALGLGLYIRNDKTGHWTNILQYPGRDDQSPRGLTLAPDPDGSGGKVLLVSRVGKEPWDGTTARCLDEVVHLGTTKATTHSYTELNVHDFYTALWGGTGFVGSNFCINPYNYWLPVKNQYGQRQWLGGQFLEHPGENLLQPIGCYPPVVTCEPGHYPIALFRRTTIQPFNGAWILYRPDLGGSNFKKYSTSLVFDYNHPEPDGMALEAIRWIQPSEFPSEKGHVLYASGWDGYLAKGMPPFHNPGWLYKGVWSKDLGF
jgi:hypothetical protein